MPETPVVGEAVLEFIAPDSSHSYVPVSQSPFFIGRGDVENHLQIPDRRISRKCAALLSEGGLYYLEDRGHRLGVFINGARIAKRALHTGDIGTFGLEDSCKLVFRSSAPSPEIENFLTRIGTMPAAESSPVGL